MVIKSVVETSRGQIRDVHERTIDAALSLGIIDNVATLQVGDVSVDFRCESHKERWRARSAMGESDIFEYLTRHLESDDIFWDVGAAVGTYSVFTSELVDEVVAFEPEPGNLRRLRENCALNGQKNIQAMRFALSDDSGTTYLKRRDGIGNGAHSVSADGDLEIDLVRGEEISPAPDVIKIDVEGHEMHALRGLGGHLEDARTIIVEVHEGVDGKDVVAFLEDENGYSVQRFNDGRESVLGGDADEFHLLARQ